MTEPNVVVTDDHACKTVTCGAARVLLFGGKRYALVSSISETAEIPNLIAALHTAFDIAIGGQHG